MNVIYNFNYLPIKITFFMKSPKFSQSYITYARFTKHPQMLSGKLLHKVPIKQSQEHHIPSKRHFHHDIVAIPQTNSNRLSRNYSVKVMTGVERLLQKASQVERLEKSGRKHYKVPDHIDLRHIELNEADWKRQLSENKKKLTYSQSVKYTKEFGPTLELPKPSQFSNRRKKYGSYCQQNQTSFQNPLNQHYVANPQKNKSAVIENPLNYKRKFSKTSSSSIVFG